MKRTRLDDSLSGQGSTRLKSSLDLVDCLPRSEAGGSKGLRTSSVTNENANDQDADAIQELAVSVRGSDAEMDAECANRTPELCSCAIGSDASLRRSPSAAPLFSMFRPTVQRKVVVVIRHGESEYNAAAKASPQWQDPKIFDPSLTPLGCWQASRLREQLANELGSNPALRGNREVLWVTSPLRRAIQTMLLSCPVLPKTNSPSEGVGASAQQRVAASLAKLQGVRLPRIKVVSEISERMLTCGDVGTPVSELRTEFSPLKGCFGEVKEGDWWHVGSKSCQRRGSFGEKETSSQFKARIAAAKRWLERQPEQVVFLYGHSVFWKAFFAQSETLRNCEYRLLHW